MKSLMLPHKYGEGQSAEAKHMEKCPINQLRRRFKEVNLRPTRQRVALGWLLFGKGNRHISAEQLFLEAQKARVPTSLATIYNTLHQFVEAGLLREINIGSDRSIFDNNTAHHHHFLLEESGEIIDYKGPIDLVISDLPPNTEISRIDITVRLRKTPLPTVD